MDDAPATLNPTAASVLGFLTTFGQMSGYDMVGMVEGSIGYFWNVTRSQVYRELGLLAGAGLVVEGEAGPRARRPYTITDAGREAFGEWMHRNPGDDILRLPFLLTYFFGQHLDAATLQRFANDHRPVHEKRLTYFRSLVPRLEHEQPYMAHVARLGCAYEETMLAWFDSIPEHLDAVRSGEGDLE